jgi:peptidoglycan hydrolase-like protein with peptidoglycan-binding domain
MTTKTELKNRFLASAENYLGYTARADGTNIFGETVGYNGKGLPWDGAFIDVCAREVGLPLTSFVYTPQALSNYLSDGRFFQTPKTGDIAFFETSTVTDFGPPHVGIVTDVSSYLTDGVFSTIEAQVSHGLPRGIVLNDGVYKRVRSSLETIGFARLNFNLTARHSEEQITSTVPEIVPAQVKPNMKHPSVQLVQLALSVVTGVRRLPRGYFDGKTRSAYAKFQRSIGYVPADGVPEFNSLQRLAKETGLFRVKV